MTAQTRLRDVLRDHVAPVLREHGFAGSGQDFDRRVDGNWVAINFQRSTYSSRDALRFTVNLGTASTAVRMEDGFAPDEPSDETDCHWRARIGELLPGGNDTWWTVSATMTDAQVEALGRELAAHLAGVCIPRLTEMAADEAILATYLAGEPEPGLSPADMDVIGPILRRLGPPRRLARFLEVVDGDGENAASLYSMLDEFPPAAGPKRTAARLEKLRSRKGFEPRQRAITELAYAAPSEEICAAIRPFLDAPDRRFRWSAALALGRLGDTSATPRLLEMVRHDPARLAATAAAFGLARLNDRLAPGDRREIRSAINERRQRAVGHDRAALSELQRRLEAA